MRFLNGHPTNSDGVSVASTFDDLNRVVTRTYPDSGVEHFGYSPAGMIAYTNQIGLSNFFGYDPLKRKTSETNANHEILSYTYSPASDLLTLTDGKSQVTTWHYDEFGRLTNKLDQASAEILRYKYDADNRLTNRWSAEKGNMMSAAPVQRCYAPLQELARRRLASTRIDPETSISPSTAITKSRNSSPAAATRLRSTPRSATLGSSAKGTRPLARETANSTLRLMSR